MIKFCNWFWWHGGWCKCIVNNITFALANLTYFNYLFFFQKKYVLKSASLTNNMANQNTKLMLHILNKVIKDHISLQDPIHLTTAPLRYHHQHDWRLKKNPYHDRPLIPTCLLFYSYIDVFFHHNREWTGTL